MIFISLVISCRDKNKQVTTPWGTTLNEDSVPGNSFTLDDIMNNGELIMLTMTGPETYYDYHNHGMGLQYLLCEKFAQQLGVSLRVEVCKDTAEMVRRLERGEGDVIAFPLPKSLKAGLRFCGASSGDSQWAVDKGSKELADTLNRWFKPKYIALIKKEEDFLLSTRSITRHVYAPMLDSSEGLISHYDRYFQMYSPMARLDWRLMAAQCYQESCFDPRAHSWAGACGLMQILPSTADHLGLPEEQMYNPEMNIAAAARYLVELQNHFRDVNDPSQRVWFALASYNGGTRHVRDAMALARKYGRNSQNFGDVSDFILKLQSPEFYNDPVVKSGYMRGEETYDYVMRIRQRWAQYRGASVGGFSSGSIGGGPGMTFGGVPTTPQRATHRYRFHV